MKHLKPIPSIFKNTGNYTSHTMNKSKQGKANRNKGHQLERDVVNILKSYGYTSSTARYSSKEMDDLLCDVITNAPLSIQCKATERLSVPVHDLLKQMKQNGLVNAAVVHKRNNKGLVVSMTFDDLIRLVDDLTIKFQAHDER